MIKIAQSDEGLGWYAYSSQEGGVQRAVYVHRIETSSGQKYAVVAGYYPTITEADVRATVKRAVSYMRSHGAKQAFGEFSRPKGPFAYGGLTIFVYNMKGIIVADMSNPAFVGQDLSNTVDGENRKVTQTIIKQAQRYERGWLSFYLKNGYVMMYVERVKIPDGEFVVGCSFYPLGKQVTTRFMVESASRLLSQNTLEYALNKFCSASSDFLRGDVFIEVMKSRIWGSRMQEVDKTGTPIARKMRSLANSGGGWIEFDYNNGIRRAYVKQVTKQRVLTTQYDIAPSEEKGSDDYVVIAGYYM
jgi:hypothetical protein